MDIQKLLGAKLNRRRLLGNLGMMGAGAVITACGGAMGQEDAPVDYDAAILNFALDTGVIDAAEWIGPYDDEILGLNTAAQFYYAPGWHEPGPSLATYVNLSEYEGLPADIQQAIQKASARANLQMLGDYDAKNGPALNRLVEAGAQLRDFPDEVLVSLEDAMNAIHEETAASNDFYGQVYESFRGFRDAIRDWHRISEYAYQNYVYRNAGGGAQGGEG